MRNSRQGLRPSVATICTIVVVGALVSLHSLSGKTSTGQNAPAPKANLSSVVTNGIPMAPAKMVGVNVPVGSVSRLDAAQVMAHLRAWRAENDPDAKAKLEQELEALLTDANASDILRALPRDWIATPFAEAALRRWTSVDRAGAANWVATQAGLTEPEQTTVIYGWGAQDKKGLDEYLNNLPAGEWKQSAMKFAANDALAGGTPRDAIELLVQMDRTPVRDDLLNWSATAWAQADSASALKWANTIQDPGQRQKDLAAVAVGLAWSDPEAAGALLSESIKPGVVLDQSALSVVCVWSQSDPQAAANWVAAFPEGMLQQTVLETLIQRWATQDSVAVNGWVNNLPDGALHQKAAQFLAAANADLQREEVVQQTSPQ